MNVKDLAKKKPGLVSGHRMCPGCGAAIIARQALLASDYPVVVANATGCLEVSTTIYPFTSWNVPWIHNAFENAAATISGVESAYQSFRRQGKIKKDIKFIAFGGDGGTYDIGLQSLSGALERGHDFLYICYDNEAYMNTGIQRSSATPKGAWTNTSQVGSAQMGKKRFKKDMTKIVIAHNIPYVAQASISNHIDFMKKVKKALDTPGPSFINVISPCPRGWRFPAHLSVDIAKLAVDTCFWPLFEYEDGVYTINYDPGKNKKPVGEWIKSQKRFAHVANDKEFLNEMQERIDKQWLELKSKVK
jgi:pyruvate ferredoxin oxidoreductase beta subunit